MTVYTWSQTAADNATADSSINYREGQAPSTLNNSGRAVMAALAKARDDRAGIILTTGTSTAYAAASNQLISSLTDGFTITLVLHVASGAAPTLNVDSTGARAIRTATSTAIADGMMLAGGRYTFTYSTADSCWYCHAVFAYPIDDATITNAKLANMAAWSIKVRNAGTSGVPSDAALADLTAASSVAATDVMVGFLSTGELRKFPASLIGVLGIAGSWTKQQRFTTATLTDGTSIAWDLDTSQAAKVTLGGNRTLSNPSNMKDGGWYSIVVTQDGTGSRTLAYDTAYKFPGGIDPVLSTAAGAIDILVFYSDGTSMYGSIQKGFA